MCNIEAQTVCPDLKGEIDKVLIKREELVCVDSWNHPIRNQLLRQLGVLNLKISIRVEKSHAWQLHLNIWSSIKWKREETYSELFILNSSAYNQ